MSYHIQSLHSVYSNQSLIYTVYDICFSFSQLNQIYGGEKPDLGDVKEESVRQTVHSILDLLHQSGGRDQTQTHKSPSLLTGTLLIISAMDGERERAGFTVVFSFRMLSNYRNLTNLPLT